MAYIPTVTENEGGNRERSFDIYSRLLKDRIILIGRPIDDVVANLVVAQLIYLSADDPEKEIQIYVNSAGGAVSAGFAIYDTMQYVRSPISTVCIGRAASFGTVILMAGAKGRRFSLPNATIHMHQPLIGGRGLQGQASDLDIHAREIIRIKSVLNELIAKHTGQALERVERDTDRDYFLSPEEAITYGLIDALPIFGACPRGLCHALSPATRRHSQATNNTPTAVGTGAGTTAAMIAPTDSTSHSIHVALPQIARATVTRTRSAGSACGETSTPPATSTATAARRSRLARRAKPRMPINARRERTATA